jgi:hypothetical protein
MAGVRAIVREVAEEFRRRGRTPTMEELNAALEGRGSAYNQRPQRELGGLSPDRAHRLLTDDWSGRGVLRVDVALPLEALASASTLRNARLLLGALNRHGAVKATAKGNLPRALMAELIPAIAWPGNGEDVLFAETGNEQDAFPFHIVRLLLELAGLIKRRSGKFSLTRRGQDHLGSAQAGALFAVLFRTHFRMLNLAYLDRWHEEVRDFQQTIAYSLFQFEQRAADWMTAERLSADLILPAVGDTISTHAGIDDVSWMLENRLLRPLEGFGLAEQRGRRGPDGFLRRWEYRKSELFERFISFAW